MFINPAGFYYGEFYLYSNKQWEMATTGASSWVLPSGVRQNAPIVVTSSGLQETQPTDPFARCDGMGKYHKVGYGNFTLLENGYVDQSQLEFALHPYASGVIVFASELRENVFIEYEGGDSSYFTYKNIDLNPMRNEFSTGFIAFSDVGEPVSINMSATNTILTSDGSQKTNILATMLDENNDPCPNQPIVFTMADTFISYLEPIGDNEVVTQSDSNGLPMQITGVTNSKGQARIQYWPISGKSGAHVVIASWGLDRNIFGYIVITQSYTLGNPFVLDSSLLDSSDYLI